MQVLSANSLDANEKEKKHLFQKFLRLKSSGDPSGDVSLETFV